MVNITIISYYFIIICLLFIIVGFIIRDELSNRKIERFIINFAEYASVLEYFEAKAYDIIYKDKLLIYSLEATKINDNEFHVISKDYAKLVIKLIGKPLLDEFKIVYGEDALFINMIEYFNKRYEDDEIRKESISNLMNKSIEEK